MRLRKPRKMANCLYRTACIFRLGRPCLRFCTADSPFIRYDERVFDPDANLPKPNRSLIYFGACLIAGMRLAREKQVNVRVIPTGTAISESVDLAYELYNCVFRRVPRELNKK